MSVTINHNYLFTEVFEKISVNEFFIYDEELYMKLFINDANLNRNIKINVYGLNISTGKLIRLSDETIVIPVNVEINTTAKNNLFKNKSNKIILCE